MRKYVIRVNDRDGNIMFGGELEAETRYDLGELIGSLVTTAKTPLVFDVMVEEDDE